MPLFNPYAGTGDGAAGAPPAAGAAAGAAAGDLQVPAEGPGPSLPEHRRPGGRHGEPRPRGRRRQRDPDQRAVGDGL